MTKKLDLAGKVFNRLTVIEENGRTRFGKVKWLCKCSCGNETTVIGSGLISGNTTSCGCLKTEINSEIHKIHGMSNTSEYQSWFDMKRRCLDPKNDHYEDYAGRGITVHTDFIESFQKWYDEIGEKPDKAHKWTVGRIDNNGSYTYGNIRWEKNETQARNHSRQKNNKTGITGVSTRIRNGIEYWSAQWVELDGTRKRKEFSCAKYPNARELAISLRKEMIKELNEKGAGYAESHGSDK